MKLRDSVKFSRIPSNTEFHRIRIPPELFFDEIIDTINPDLVNMETEPKHWFNPIPEVLADSQQIKWPTTEKLQSVGQTVNCPNIPEIPQNEL